MSESMGAHKEHLLFVYPHADPLDPAGSGGQNRLYHFIDQMSRRFDITVIGPTSKLESTEMFEVRTYDQKIPGFLSDLDHGLATTLYETIRSVEPDVIHVPYPSGIILSQTLLVITRTNAKIVLDAHDVMSERAREFVNDNLGSVSKQLRGLYVPNLESIATSIADQIITVSEKDARLMNCLNGVPQDKLSVVPNGAELLDTGELTPRETVREELDVNPDTTAIIFHGNHETGTHNREAADRIITKIAPPFQGQEDIHFFIIGQGAPETAVDNVTSLGFVDDLYSTLNAMDLAVVPLQSGTATKLKMFDYMTVGLPIISSEKGTEGIDLEDGTNVVVSKLATESFIRNIRKLLEDDQLRYEIGTSGRRLIEERYNWQVIGNELNDVYQRLISG